MLELVGTDEVMYLPAPDGRGFLANIESSRLAYILFLPYKSVPQIFGRIPRWNYDCRETLWSEDAAYLTNG